nr:MAG TPA: hypothetical protein [Podoviridae sp. ct1Pw90]
MNIKEVFEKCNDGDFVKDNNGNQWKVENEDLIANYWYKNIKGDLTANCCHINDYYNLKELVDLQFNKVYVVDWSKVEVDTKILVSSDNKRWYRRYFAKFENDKIYTFDNGTTSFTYNYTGLVPWEYAKIYKEEK